MVNDDGRLVGSVVRALDVLARVCGAPEGMALKDVAAATGMKPPALHKVLRTLAARGFVERVERPVRYRRGPAIRLLAEGGDAFLAAAEAALGDLAGRFPAAVFTLSRMADGDVAVVLRISPERPGRVERPAGRTLSPYVSASGAAMQAWMAADERAAYRLRRPFGDEGGHVWGTEAAFDRFLAGARRRGCSAPRFSARGGRTFAVPVFDGDGRVAAVVGGSLPPDRRAERARRLEHDLKRAAAALTAGRGGRGPGAGAAAGKQRRRTG